MVHPLASIMGIHFKSQLYLKRETIMLLYVTMFHSIWEWGKHVPQYKCQHKTLTNHTQDSLPHKLNYMEHSFNHHFYETLLLFPSSIKEIVFPSLIQEELIYVLKYTSYVFVFGIPYSFTYLPYYIFLV